MQGGSWPLRGTPKQPSFTRMGQVPLAEHPQKADCLGNGEDAGLTR